MADVSCKVEAESQAGQGSYEELVEAMADDKYWYRFFLRPCCPAPGAASAAKLTERLKGELDGRPDFTDEQRADIARIIDERLEWYTHLGICKSKN